jgi:hypothetical protein
VGSGGSDGGRPTRNSECIAAVDLKQSVVIADVEVGDPAQVRRIAHEMAAGGCPSRGSAITRPSWPQRDRDLRAAAQGLGLAVDSASVEDRDEQHKTPVPVAPRVAP